MKKIIVALLVLCASFSFYAFRAFEAPAADFLKQLGVPEFQARDYIWSSFSGMYFSYPMNNQIRHTAAGQRASLVREIGAYAKAYTQSGDFKTKYLENRENAKPTPPEPPKSVEQQRKEQKENLQTALHETEESMKTMTPDLQATMKDVVKMYKEQLKSLDDPNNPIFSQQMADMWRQSHEQAMKDYKEKLAKWEKDYPMSPNRMVKQWLTKFFDESNNVDFNAKLIDGDYGKKMFAKTGYERKPSNWKMCFRAGLETVEAGRTFAQQWLAELK